MPKKYLLIWWAGTREMFKQTQEFDHPGEAHDFIYEKKIKEYRVYKLWEWN